VDDRYRVVAVHENSAGSVDFDDLGQPRWKWVTEIQAAELSDESTFDYLKALSNVDLTLAEDPQACAAAPSKDARIQPLRTGRPHGRQALPAEVGRRARLQVGDSGLWRAGVSPVGEITSLIVQPAVIRELYHSRLSRWE
jgi:hypothetical protein